MLAGDAGVGGEGQVGGGGADRVVRAVLGERLQDDAGLEAVAEHQGARAVQAGAELADHPGDVEQRGQRVVDGRLGQIEPRALALGVVHDVAVRVGGALRGAAGPRGVADQGDVAGTRITALGSRAAPPGDGGQVVGVGGLGQPLEAEHARVVTRLEVPLAPGEHDPHRRVGGRLPQVPLPGAVGADQRGDLAVPQDVTDLGRLVHGVDGHDGRARLPGAEDGQHEVRGVLQQDGYPVAALHPASGEVGGHRVAQLVDLAVGQPGVEVGEEGALGGLGHGAAQGVHEGVGGPDRLALGLAEQGEPGPGPVGGGAHSAASHFCWMWFMPASQRSGVAARAW